MDIVVKMDSLALSSNDEVDYNRLNEEMVNGVNDNDIVNSVPGCSNVSTSFRRSKRLSLKFPETAETKPANKKKPVAANAESDFKTLKKIYLSKSIKLKNPSLETIFEDPQGEKIMSGRKFRRNLNFASTSKGTVKKWTAKAKTLISRYRKIKKNKIPMNDFIKKIESISETD